MPVSTDGRPDEQQSSLLPSSPSPTPSASSVPERRTGWSPTTISCLLLLAVICAGTADGVSMPALMRIYESIYCRQYYRVEDPSLTRHDGGDGVPEEHYVFDAAGSLPLAVPWGYFADTYGRKPLLIICALSFFARSVWIQIVCYFWKTFPIKLVWLAGLHSVFGGSSVCSAVLYTVVADVMPQEERVAMFFRLGAAQLFTSFISSPLSALLMQPGLFVPTLVGSGMWILFIGITIIIPETLNYNSGPKVHIEEEETTSSSLAPSPEKTFRQRIRQLLSQIRASTAFLTLDIRVALLVPTYCIHMLLYNTNELLLQYVSARFHISISDATLIVSLQSALVIITLLFILPALTHHLTTRLHLSAQLKDLRLARSSAAFMAVGFLGVGLAPSLPWLITALPVEVAGWGLMFLIRGLITSFVEPHHVARLYTVLSLVDVAGLMLGSPVIAELFERGLDLGNAAMGLPFLVCAVLVVAVEGILWTIGVEESKEERERSMRSESDDEDFEVAASG